MITKEKLEETIRGVICEFKAPKRIPDPTADELTEILTPFREGFSKSGMTEEQLDTLFEQAREKVYKEDQTKKNEPFRSKSKLSFTGVGASGRSSIAKNSERILRRKANRRAAW